MERGQNVTDTDTMNTALMEEKFQLGN